MSLDSAGLGNDEREEGAWYSLGSAATERPTSTVTEELRFGRLFGDGNEGKIYATR